MRYLLDTNIFVYLALDSDMLSRDVYDIISHAITLNMPLISSDTRFSFYRRQGRDFIYNEK